MKSRTKLVVSAWGEGGHARARATRRADGSYTFSAVPALFFPYRTALLESDLDPVTLIIRTWLHRYCTHEADVFFGVLQSG